VPNQTLHRTPIASRFLCNSLALNLLHKGRATSGVAELGVSAPQPEPETKSMPADYFKLYKSLGMTSESDMASALQRAVMSDESDHLQNGIDLYTEEQKTQAIVHTRQDIILLVSYASSISKKMAKSLFWLGTISVLLAFLLLAVYFR